MTPDQGCQSPQPQHRPGSTYFNQLIFAAIQFRKLLSFLVDLKIVVLDFASEKGNTGEKESWYLGRQLQFPWTKQLTVEQTVPGGPSSTLLSTLFLFHRSLSPKRNARLYSIMVLDHSDLSFLWFSLNFSAMTRLLNRPFLIKQAWKLNRIKSSKNVD